jgi:hypothetical protein
MRVLLSGIVVAAVIAVVAAFALRLAQEPVYERFSSSSARVGDPGINLVGKSWSGDPRVSPQARKEKLADSKPGAD